MSNSNTITAKDAKNRFGELLDAARVAPVHITKNGREVAVMLSQEAYQQFEMAEDAQWSARAQKVLATAEFVGPRKSAALLQRILDTDARA